MRVSFTATHYLAGDAHLAIVRRLLETLDPDDEVGVGCCIGGDAAVGRLAHELGHLVHGSGPRWSRRTSAYTMGATWLATLPWRSRGVA